MTYCTDTDLLFWEPDLAAEARIAADVIHAGRVERCGTQLRFIDAPARPIAPGHLVCVDGATHPIAAVDGGALTFSPMLQRASTGATGRGIALVCTFEAQRAIVSRAIESTLRLRASDRIVVTDRLRRIASLSALLVMSAQLSIFSPASARWSVRREVYARLLRREMRAGPVGIDTNADGVADVHRAWSLPAELATEVL